MSLPSSSIPVSASPYRVLARKYRPINFQDLIGQEAMVRTLTNAFRLNRLPQAYILTGVRGIGKTTTARILARAFNYELADRPGKTGIHAPNAAMEELGVHCASILESRHVDVIEMDAASHTSIEDIREIIESIRYVPVSARYKIYIIDEVHMLSKSAFNGLLKTLEEPPDHVKFIFATTEIDKVPVTIRSRCQRFDLRRIEPEVLTRHLEQICVKENVSITSPALALIVRASEGSVRDSLSLLDQAIAYGASPPSSPSASSLSDSPIQIQDIQTMLGLVDQTQVIDLFEFLLRGDLAKALPRLQENYALGADLFQLVVDLSEFVHFVTQLKLVPLSAPKAHLTSAQMDRGQAFADLLPISVLMRLWQILLKGFQEIKDSPRPLGATEMLFVRIAQAADLPPLEEALRYLQNSLSSPLNAGTPNAGGSSTSASAPLSPAPVARQSERESPLASSPLPPKASAQESPNPVVPNLTSLPETFEDLVALAEARRDIQLKIILEQDVRLIHFAPGRLEFALAPGASLKLPTYLSERLKLLTQHSWTIILAPSADRATIQEARASKDMQKQDMIRNHPFVKKVLKVFPEAKIIHVRARDLECVPQTPFET